MKKREVISYYHPVLRKRAKEVNAGVETENLIKEMKRVLRKEKGAGLAAPQIGVSKRVVVIDTADEQMIAFLNPVIKKKGEKKMTVKEGCLSLKGVWLDVERSSEVVVSFLTQDGKEMEMEVKGILAIVLQHEIDHLNGKLLIDYARFFPRMKMLFSYFLKKNE